MAVPRTRLLYVTIDNYDRCAPGEWGHANNILRLDAVAHPGLAGGRERLAGIAVFAHGAHQARLAATQ